MLLVVSTTSNMYNTNMKLSSFTLCSNDWRVSNPSRAKSNTNTNNMLRCPDQHSKPVLQNTRDKTNTRLVSRRLCDRLNFGKRYRCYICLQSNEKSPALTSRY
jgi:hypothetical protein